jgi:hypothetical protein
MRLCAWKSNAPLKRVLDHKRWILLPANKTSTCDEKYLTNRIVDLVKVQPILFSMFDASYWTLGEQFVAQAWNIGKELKRG